MRVVVFGAQGGVGRWAVQIAAQRGHWVVAAARTMPAEPPADYHIVPAVVDVLDSEAVRRAIRRADAVLWCIGVSGHSSGTVGRVSLPHLVAAAVEEGVSRLVSVSGAAVLTPGDQRDLGSRMIAALARRLGGDVIADKQGEHHILSTSSLSWTEVRPPRLTSEPATGRWLLTQTQPRLTAEPVPRADVAAAMVNLIEHPDWIHRSPFLTLAPAEDKPTSTPPATD